MKSSDRSKKYHCGPRGGAAISNRLLRRLSAKNQFLFVIGLAVFFASSCSPAQNPRSSGPQISQDVVNTVKKSIVYLRLSEAPDSIIFRAATGFIIDPDGVVATNCHNLVTRNAEVILADDRRFPIIEVIQANLEEDICLVKINAKNLPALKYAEQTPLMTGEIVFTVGNPQGEHFVLTSGYISRIINAANSDEIESDTLRIEPGNSGGPLMYQDGVVVGVLKGISIIRNTAMASSFQDLRMDPAKAVNMPWKEYLASSLHQGLKSYVNSFELYEQGKTFEAIAEAEKAVRINPTSNCYDAVGTFYSHIKQNDKAIAAWQQALQINPYARATLMKLGITYFDQNNFSQAAEIFKAYLMIDPSYDVAQDYLERASRR